MNYSVCGEVVFKSISPVIQKKFCYKFITLWQLNCQVMLLGSSTFLSSNFGCLYGNKKKRMVLIIACVCQKVSYFIFTLEKILSHSLTPFRDFRRKKKYSPEISDYQGLGRWPWVNPHQNDKKKWSYELHFRKNTNSHHIIRFFSHENGYRGLTTRFFFFRESWRGKKKNTAIFTHSHLLWDFHAKSIFPGKKKYDTFGLPKAELNTKNETKGTSRWPVGLVFWCSTQLLIPVKKCSIRQRKSCTLVEKRFMICF